jgi:hypothetical protein
MRSRLTQETLNWANLEKISTPITPFQLKMIATVLTRKGIGTVLCPKCNILNIVRDGKFQCYCGLESNIIDCACHICGIQLLDKGVHGKLHQYILGHSSIGPKNSMWNGGRKLSNGYWLLYRPQHHFAYKNCVPEHRIIVEDEWNCCLLPWANVHHRDGNKLNNVWYNLWPMMNGQHIRQHRIMDGLKPQNPYRPTISNDRKCYICNGMTQVENGHPHWRVLDGQYVCNRCYNRETYRRRNHVIKYRLRKPTTEDVLSIGKLLKKSDGPSEVDQMIKTMTKYGVENNDDYGT